jgi:L-fuconolactonase
MPRPSPRIDAHQHFWRYHPADFEWIEPGGRLAADFLPDDLAPILAAYGFDGAIAVQARASEAETRWLLDLAGRHRSIAGVVGWCDLTAADAEHRIDVLAANPSLVGFRHIVQDEVQGDFLLRRDFARGVGAVLARRLAYDVLIFARHARHLPAFIEAVGPGTLVLDHAAKPDIRGGGWRPWATDIARAALFPGLVCKLSGLVTEADHRLWKPDDFERYLDWLFEHFGPDRLLYGSDWPVCLLAARYERQLALIEDYVARRCPQARDAIFGGNATRVYRIGSPGQIAG